VQKKKNGKHCCKNRENVKIGVDYGLLLDQIKKRRGPGNRLINNVLVEDLVFLLRSAGQEIPADLIHRLENKPVLTSFQRCWEFWGESRYSENCAECMVFANKIDHCFSARRKKCPGCRYFREYVHPRIGFIHQIDQPLAVCKRLCFWAGNKSFAKLCGLQPNDLIGLGFEKVFHADSLGIVIAGFKKYALGGSGQEATYKTFLTSDSLKKEIRISVHSLNNPEQTFLILVNG